ncbi:hypothetical protein ACLOJK_036688 [Asimina triloba]
MLGIFQKSVAEPPKELNSTAAAAAPATLPCGAAAAGGSAKGPGGVDCKKAMQPNEILRAFVSAHPVDATLSASMGDGRAIMAYFRHDNNRSILKHQRLFCGLDDMYCLFLGNLINLSTLIKQYGLSKAANEAMLVIEAYRTLRDRGPYPADQVVKDFNGSFAFVVYDSKATTVFAALIIKISVVVVVVVGQGSDEAVELYWGIAADGSVVISDNLDIIKGGCGRSFAPFPAGCMFHSEGGLKSFEHPMHKMKPVPRVDSEGLICGADFNVDKYSRVSSIPRVGSEANWTAWTSH